MDRLYGAHERIQPSLPSLPNILAYAIAAVFIVHQLLTYFDIAILSPVEILWNTLVYTAPTRLVLSATKRAELRLETNTWAQTHAAKSEAMRSILGLGGTALLQQLPSAGSSIARKLSFAAGKAQSDAPPGLGNWDNSCYQNSVLQGLSSIEALRPFLGALAASDALPESRTSTSLEETVLKLSNGSHNGKHFWTPAKLKSMSSWQQQDAQEYYSKLVDELEKEAGKVFKATQSKDGLEVITEDHKTGRRRPVESTLTNPLEGLLAQRVACTRCGNSDGLSMIPFNCLTVPLGSNGEYNLSQCLDAYTQLEDISDVECAKCTLLRAQTDLKRRLPSSEPGSPGVKAMLELPPALRVAMAERLRAVEEALEVDDFTDKTVSKTCQISKANRVSSTKTRQAVIGRAPGALVIHVQRSVFDEMTGAQRKNYAAVRFPSVLDLGPWTVDYHGASDGGNERVVQSAATEASVSMLTEKASAQCLYRLKAVVTHYGRHENGHYIAYRQHPAAPHPRSTVAEDDEQIDVNEELSGKHPWWRLSDEDVSSVSLEDVLGQGGVFMLFYERIASTARPTSPDALLRASSSVAEPALPSAATNAIKTDSTQDDTVSSPSHCDDTLSLASSTPLPVDMADADMEADECSTGATTEDESEVDTEEIVLGPVQPVPQLRMRTARIGKRRDGDFGARQRFVEAS